MKIAIFTDTYTPQVNGVAKTLKRLTAYLDGKSISYRVYAPAASGTKDHNQNVIRFKSFPFWCYPECRLAFPHLSKVKKDMKDFKPDLIHIATPFNIGLVGLYVGKKMNIPVVGSYHTHFDQYLDYYHLSFLAPFAWRYMRWFHHSFKKTFIPSLHTKQKLKIQGFHNIKLWKRGVDRKHFKPITDSEQHVRNYYNIKAPYLFSYVGRLAPEKGLDTLIEISKRMPPHVNKNIHWLIVGDGPLRRSLQMKAPLNMTFTGYQDGIRLAQIFASSTLFVFPSETETFGNVALESLACGTPVIGASAGGIQEIVTHKKTGILCRPGDVESFTTAILSLLSDPAKLAAMSKLAREETRDWGWDDIFEQLLRDYQNVVDNRSHPSLA
ncbi:Glycosyltransferase involved in cell wall bisynthesis [Halobacillus karajensis]|uniref:glycosyltransferase family 4 protein n=1 Tax=Halobacillus karajensis TaxID=195088 RepID=UPI0008A7B474|nr:glycosyltransferase family 1 protein [Halobacillus karajensis]SEH82904.1 Glycosyltransferase involved in cell wall bisynthesis [Halobacillus karajensis]